MMEGGLFIVAVALFWIAFAAVAVDLCSRVTDRSWSEQEDAKHRLEARLSRGEISPEDYFHRHTWMTGI